MRWLSPPAAAGKLRRLLPRGPACVHHGGRRGLSSQSADLELKSYFVASRDKKHQLHLQRIRLPGPEDGSRPVCLLFHGAIENGRIFYSKSNKGLAPFLARGNCDVFVADFRGRGGSKPSIAQYPDHGQAELINDDVLALSDGVREISGRPKQHWIAHSWGGVILGCSLARYPQYAEEVVASQVWLGAKRTISVSNLSKFLAADLMWDRVFPLLARFYGYIPAKKFRLGGEDEPLRYVTEVSQWITKKEGGGQQGGAAPWKDPVDGFDYHQAAEALSRYPPTWSIAGKADLALGNPIDVRRFVEEHERHREAFKFTVLSKENGNLHDYDHVNMLTHRDVDRDHAPHILQWILDHHAAAKAP